MDKSHVSFIRTHALESLRALLLKHPSTNRYGFQYELAGGSSTLQVYYRGRLIGLWTYLHNRLVFNVVDRNCLSLETPDVEQAFLITREIVKRLLFGAQPNY